MKPRQDCPGCGATALSPAFVLPRQPVVLNYRFPDAASATRVKRRDITLAQCRGCGLVFNTTFDISVIPYDSHYENRQSFSPAFNKHLEQLAQRLIRRNRLRLGRILEVGCGKGDFLRLLCRLAEAEGVGYDTSYEPPATPEPRKVSFHRRYVTPADIARPFDAIVCRHVVEHIPEIGAFLRELRAIAAAAGDPVVVLETPRFEWVVEQVSIWDVFYEHCNYFPTATLVHLCRLAGFRVARHRAVFGQQYQILELKLAKARRVLAPPGIPPGARLSVFAGNAGVHLERLRKRLAAKSNGRGWAVWGAGAKGVALVNQLPGMAPRCIVDSNPAKQGGVLAGTRIPIVAPDDPRIGGLGLVLIANPNYAAEIRETLAHRCFAGETITL